MKKNTLLIVGVVAAIGAFYLMSKKKSQILPTGSIPGVAGLGAQHMIPGVHYQMGTWNDQSQVSGLGAMKLMPGIDYTTPDGYSMNVDINENHRPIGDFGRPVGGFDIPDPYHAMTTLRGAGMGPIQNDSRYDGVTTRI